MTIEWHKVVHMSPEHHALRVPDVTASEYPALHGVHPDPQMTPLRLWTAQRGVEFPKNDSKVMRRGRKFERAAADWVADDNPQWQIEPAGVYVRDSELRLGASPDFFIRGDERGLGILEIKTSGRREYESKWDNGQEPPLAVSLQVAVQMMLCDAAFGVIGVLIVDPYDPDCITLPVPRLAAAEQKIRNTVANFWQLVRDGIEPPPDFGRDTQIIKALHPHEVPGKGLDLTGNNYVVELLEQRALLKARINADDARCLEIENELRFMLKDAEFATGINGWKVTYKTGTRSAYSVPEKTMRTLRILDRRPD